MADVQAFAGVRYEEEAAGEPGTLIAPPYDAATPEHFARLRALNPFNIVHLEQAEADDEENLDHHAVAAARYGAWRREGVLRHDQIRALYLYEQDFTHAGRPLTRRALFAAVRLADWSERIILPHEETFPGPRQERLDRLRAVRANLSPIYLLYQDPAGELRSLVQAVQRTPAVVARDLAGERHRLTIVDDQAVITGVGRFFAGHRLYVADGHHRYEAALAYRDERRRAAGRVDPKAPEEFILAALAAVDDPGVLVLPTHRLLHGLPNFDPDRIREQLAAWFDLRPTPGVPPRPAPGTIATLRFGGEANAWELRAKAGAPHLALLPPERSAAWRQLDVAVVGAILRRLLDIPLERLPEHLSFAHDTGSALAALMSGEAQMAFLLRPTSLPELLAVADAGERMPPKSTYFHPKIPAGLVLHDFGDGGPTNH